MGITSNGSVIFHRNVDGEGNPISISISNEQVEVFNNKGYLNQVPDEYYRVALYDNTVGDMTEIDIRAEITSANQYKVLYGNERLIYLHSSKEGRTLKATYYGIGYTFIPSDGVYTQINGTGDATETLQTIINSGKLIWKSPVATYAQIAQTYTPATEAWAVQTTSDNKVYRYDGTSWVYVQVVSKGDKGDTGDVGATGSTGATGPTGKSYNPRGGWLTATPYVNNTSLIDTVYYNGNSYYCKLSHTSSGSILPTNTTYWELLAQKGDSGSSTAADTSYDNTASELTATTVQAAIDEINTEKVNTTDIINNLTQSTSGKVLDASQGKILDDKITTINTTLSSGTTTSPTVSVGMNSVIHKTDNVESFPKFTMTGKNYTNLFGKDGNCDDTSKWNVWNCTTTLDTTNKVFGVNGFKLTISSTTGAVVKNLGIIPTVDVAKYYLASAYVKNGNATNVYLTKDNTSGGTQVSSSTVTSTTSFTRIGIKLSPSSMNTGNNIGIYVSGASTQYAYTDGIQINEITATEYALTTTELLAKYPYVDSYACLQNPYIEVKHDNLVRNGNGEEGIAWWMPVNSTISYSGGYIILNDNDAAGWSTAAQKIAVKPSTQYTIKLISKNGACRINGYTEPACITVSETNLIQVENTLSTDVTLSQTFTTGTNTYGISLEILQRLSDLTTTGNSYFKEIQLIESSTVPTSYKPCRIERCVVEGKFTGDDSFTYENGKADGLLNWKHKPLFGKDYSWTYSADYTGYKQAVVLGFSKDANYSVEQKSIKYDGKILKPWNAGIPADTCWIGSDTNLYLEISDTDTGWAEAIAPNNDEVKAFMNGWKAIWNDNNRYTSFISIVDKSLPAATIQAPVSATTATTTITVSSGGLQFLTGDTILILTSAMGVRTSATVTGTSTATTIRVTASTSVVSGDIVVKKDNGGSGIVNLITYCKNNIAPGYEGYQIHYKLANPEPITNANIHIHGNVPKFDNGDNYLYLDYGMVIGEVANCNTTSDGSYYEINTLLGWSVVPYDTRLKNKAELMFSIYKNGIYDNNNGWSIATNDNYSNGIARSSILKASFDTSADYTVDYQILKTIHTFPATITMSYQQDVLNAISDLAEIVNSKQNHNTVLDTLVDLSIYERITGMAQWGRFFHSSVGESMYMAFRVGEKKCNPVATLSNIVANYLDSVGTMYTIPPSDLTIGVNSSFKNIARVQANYVGSNATIKSNLLAYGGLISFTIELDCRSRLT